MRILCLHGSRQSAAILQKRCKTLLRKSAAVADLVFMNAPHVRPVSAGEKGRSEAAGQGAQDPGGREGLGEDVTYCWWLPGLAKGESHPEWEAQWHVSREALMRVLGDASAQGQPFVGILGFSNGAAAAALLLAAPPPAGCPPLRFALLAGGYLPNILAGTCAQLDIPSLHMHGTADTFITEQQAQQLRRLFEGPQVLAHEQGHVIPQRSADTAVIMAFLREQLSRKSAQGADGGVGSAKTGPRAGDGDGARGGGSDRHPGVTEARPLLLHGYGAYGLSSDPEFSANVLTLCDAGVVYAVAHVRGGGELGVRWHEAARLSRKQTTFDDFQMCARFLIEQGWTEAGRIAALGASAGGLLIGVAANEAPNLYGAMVAQVPFVDAVVTMADPTMPLVANEWDEWGNPNEPVAFEYLSKYSPIDQVKPQPYPPMLLQAGLWDHRVCYWEVAKFAQRLREKSTSSSPILFRCDMGEGHGSGKVCITHKIKTHVLLSYCYRALACSVCSLERCRTRLHAQALPNLTFRARTGQIQRTP